MSRSCRDTDRPSAAASTVEIVVSDSGPGIPVEDRARIFDAFYTGKPSASSVKGTGIGLSVVMEFVTVHGGSVEIVDGEFSGAHFRIRMPMRAESPADLETAHAA